MIDRNSWTLAGLSALLMLTVPTLLSISAVFTAYPSKILFLLPVLCFLFWQAIRRNPRWFRPKWPDIAAIPLLTVFTLFLGWIFSGLTDGKSPNPSADIASISILSMFSAIIEELYFRFWLPMKLGDIGWTRNAAMGASVLLFGLTHYWQGWHAVVYACIVGFVYSLLITKRQCLSTLIIAHSLHNLCAILLGSIGIRA